MSPPTFVDHQRQRQFSTSALMHSIQLVLHIILLAPLSKGQTNSLSRHTHPRFILIAKTNLAEHALDDRSLLQSAISYDVNELQFRK